MKREILDVLELWSWATFTGGVFKVTRFCSDEVLAEVSVDEFYRNHTDIWTMGLTAAEIPEGVEYLVPSRRYTDPDERHRQYAKYVDPGKRPRGYLRLLEVALFVLSAKAGATAHQQIETHNKSKGR